MGFIELLGLKELVEDVPHIDLVLPGLSDHDGGGRYDLVGLFAVFKYGGDPLVGLVQLLIGSKYVIFLLVGCSCLQNRYQFHNVYLHLLEFHEPALLGFEHLVHLSLERVRDLKTH